VRGEEIDQGLVAEPNEYTSPRVYRLAAHISERLAPGAVPPFLPLPDTVHGKPVVLLFGSFT
jgi:hypothetical protein